MYDYMTFFFYLFSYTLVATRGAKFIRHERQNGYYTEIFPLQRKFT
jgi:hypothetical protein